MTSRTSVGHRVSVTRSDGQPRYSGLNFCATLGVQGCGLVRQLVIVHVEVDRIGEATRLGVPLSVNRSLRL